MELLIARIALCVYLFATSGIAFLRDEYRRGGIMLMSLVQLGFSAVNAGQ